MAFFDRVSSVAKGIADGAKGVADSAKLTIKISGIEHEISELKLKLGEAVWAIRSCGSEKCDISDDAVNSICAEIQSAYDRIDALNAEQREKQENRSEPIFTDAEQEQPSKNSECCCIECGSILAEDWNFCPVCGKKLPEEPEVSMEETETFEEAEASLTNKCVNCGAELSDDQNFCPICGTKR